MCVCVCVLCKYVCVCVLCVCMCAWGYIQSSWFPSPPMLTLRRVCRCSLDSSHNCGGYCAHFPTSRLLSARVTYMWRGKITSLKSARSCLNGTSYACIHTYAGKQLQHAKSHPAVSGPPSWRNENNKNNKDPSIGVPSSERFLIAGYTAL